MARPRSEERRKAILSGATRVIASQGLGASTAAMAKEAGVSNGSLFLYFETKTVLLRELYLGLKTEMGAAAVADLPTDKELSEQVRHMWTRWLRWATGNPEKQRALAQLQVAEDVTEGSHQTVARALDGIAGIVERSRTGGPLRDASIGFVLNLTNAIADATIEAMLREPELAHAHGDAAFTAIWHVLSGSAPPPPANPTRNG